MSRNYLLYLEDIRQACSRILRYTNGLTKDEFFADEKTYDAVMRQLTIIGEAVKHIPLDVRDLYPAVAWKPIGRFRDIVVHHYFGVDEKIVWHSVSVEIAELLAELSVEKTEPI